MQVLQAQVQQHSEYEYRHEQRQVLSTNPADLPSAPRSSPITPPPTSTVAASNTAAGDSNSSNTAKAATSSSPSDDDNALRATELTDALQRSTVLLLEALTGRRFELYQPPQPEVNQEAKPPTESAPSQPPAELQLQIYEQEQLSYRAQGSVQTDDGRTIHFDYQLQLSRELLIEAGSEQAQPQDPLLLVLPGSNLSVAPGSPGNGDLTTHSGTGYLFIDHDGDGKLSEGELIGERSGDGFAELAALDEDGNGFIDQGDSIFSQIYFYQSDGPASRLEELGVAALSVDASATPYHFKQGDSTYAMLRASSFALMEDGRAAGLHQLDLFS
ncbi:hypothetical protein [Aliagarivorans taiwanensis]|uniref:hypothetical protein n=1 Tax=Aliagarivorans taiwanensis TaxID=561966 RepID=UPI0003FF7C70|nr:hypothetical protein [Aliagarivorans taiwanensis]